MIVRKPFLGSAVTALAVAALLGMSTFSAAEFQEVMVPMRDGVKLATNISTPDGDGPWPVILSRTPYNKDGRGAGNGERREQGGEFLERGYAYVTQDVRGMFKSEGEYRAFVDDIEDGYDTIEWIAEQPWSNGKVGMVGGSATGITANLAAMSSPPHLVCAHVTVAHGSGYRNSRHPGGLYLLSLVEDWMSGRGVEPAKVPRPIIDIYDEQDRKLDIQHYYSKIKIPMYNVGGWYDIFLKGNIENFAGLQYQGGEGAKGNQKLIMGAFGHGQLRGDLKYPDESGGLRGDRTEMFRFFDYWMKGEDTGINDEPPVRYYVMGDTFDEASPGNEWRTADVWPPESTATSYYLHAGNKLSLEAPSENGGDVVATDATSYEYDPNNPVPTVGGNNLSLPIGPMDQREVSGRDDVVKFETDPLESPVEVIGHITAELFVSTSAEDTDFIVKLVDVYPNGYEALVRDQGTRLRFREGFDKMVKAEAGEVYKIDVDLWSTALVFNKGHKIAIHVQSSNARRFEPHSNTWDPVDDYATQAVTATNTIHHSAGHTSRLILPVTKVY